MMSRILGSHLDTTFRGWSVYLPSALHGIEASLLAFDSLLKLRSSICRVVWSRRQPC